MKKVHTRIVSKKNKITKVEKTEKSNFQLIMSSPVTPGQIILALMIELSLIIKAML